MKIQKHSKLLFIGDSITAAGRAELGEPTPWDANAGLGHGYVNLVNALMMSRSPELGIRVMNRGVSGNTVLDLQSRWERDVLIIQPDWLSVMIGINDVWRQFDCPLAAETHVLPEQFKATYRELLQQVRGDLEGLVLMSPYVIERNPEDPMRQRMSEYGAIAKELAAEFDAIYADTQLAIDAVMQHTHPTSIAWDRIHPSTVGHMVIARAFLDSVDFTSGV